MGCGQQSPIFRLSPDLPGHHPSLMVQADENSDIFSYVASAPLNVPRANPTDDPSLSPSLPRPLSLPPPVTVIRSTGKLDRVTSASEFPLERQTSSSPSLPDEEESPVSPAPRFDVTLGPKLPPAPAPAHQPSHSKRGLPVMVDPLADYMEERLARFNPSVSQNNPDAPLDCKHPYQQNDRGRPRKNRPSEDLNRTEDLNPVAPVPEPSPPAPRAPQINSSSSFLPRGRLAVFLAEPSSAQMALTPRAEAYADAKGENVVDEADGLAGQLAWCVCCGL